MATDRCEIFAVYACPRGAEIPGGLGFAATRAMRISAAVEEFENWLEHVIGPDELPRPGKNEPRVPQVRQV